MEYDSKSFWMWFSKHINNLNIFFLHRRNIFVSEALTVWPLDFNLTTFLFELQHKYNIESFLIIVILDNQQYRKDIPNNEIHITIQVKKI